MRMQDSTAALLQEAAELHGRGALAQAAGRFRQVLEREPQQATAPYHLAVIECQAGRSEEALASYDRALAIGGRSPEALQGRGVVLLKLDRIEGALANFEEALALAPNRPGTLRLLVEALIGRSELTRALDTVTRALR